MIFIKNIKTEPEAVPNDGSAVATLQCDVVTPNDDARIEEVRVNLSSVGDPAMPSMEPVPDAILVKTSEGTYTTTFPVPYLTEPGDHELILRSKDSTGDAGEDRARMRVSYRRPPHAFGLGDEAGRALLERVGGTRIVGGNRVEPLPDGSDALEKRLDLIRGATRQINLQSYTLDDEGESGRLMQNLQERARDGVEVNVILNAATQIATSPFSALRLKFQGAYQQLLNIGRLFEKDLSSVRDLVSVGEEFVEITRNFEKRLREVNLLFFDADRLRKVSAVLREDGRAGVWLRRYAQSKGGVKAEDLIAEWTKRFKGPAGLPAVPMLDFAIHEKILVADGTRAVIGGRNLDDRYFSRWIDLDVFLEGPIVRNVQDGFLRSYEDFAGDKERPRPSALLPQPEAAGDVPALFVQSRPWAGDLRAHDILIAAVQAARKRIRISSQYIVLPDCYFLDALLEAAARGVEIVILTNSFETCTEVAYSTGYFISLNYFKPLLDAGVKVYTANGTGNPDEPQPYYHAKEFHFDGEVAFFGSVNLSLRSFYIESENLVAVFDRALTQKMEKLFEERLRTSTTEMTRERLEESLEAHRNRAELAKLAELLY